MQDIAKEWRSVRPLGSASAPAPTRLANVSPSGLTRPATSPGQFNTTRVVRDQGAAARVGAVRPVKQPVVNVMEHQLLYCLAARSSWLSS